MSRMYFFAERDVDDHGPATTPGLAIARAQEATKRAMAIGLQTVINCGLAQASDNVRRASRATDKR